MSPDPDYRVEWPEPDDRMLLDPRVNSIGRCRYVIGETDGARTLFCGAPVAHVLTSYCRSCHARCHAPHTATGKGFSAGWDHKAAA